MASPTYYNILGVEATATTDQIRRAYRARAKSLHPDVSTAPDAQARFAELATAYETLANKAKRFDYDASLRTGPAKPGRERRSSTAAHYTWTNIATDASDKPDRLSEFDELYETFFTPHASKSRSKKRA